MYLHFLKWLNHSFIQLVMDHDGCSVRNMDKTSINDRWTWFAPESCQVDFHWQWWWRQLPWCHASSMTSTNWVLCYCFDWVTPWWPKDNWLVRVSLRRLYFNSVHVCPGSGDKEPEKNEAENTAITLLCLNYVWNHCCIKCNPLVGVGGHTMYWMWVLDQFQRLFDLSFRIRLL